MWRRIWIAPLGLLYVAVVVLDGSRAARVSAALAALAIVAGSIAFFR